MSVSEIQTKFPLSMDDLKSVITNPEVNIIADYKQCQIKDRALLIYLGNINVANVFFDKGACEEKDFYELVDSYITFKSVIDLINLKYSMIQILFAIKGIALNEIEQKTVDHFSLISQEGVRDYLADEKRLDNVLKMMLLIDNFPTFMYTCSKEFRDGEVLPEDTFQVIDDLDFTGFTFTTLLKLPLFYMHYFTSMTVEHPFYFKQQFDEFFYNGKNLFAETFQSCPELYSAMNMALVGKITPESIEKVNQELDVLINA